MSRVIVVGGGPAGAMAAIQAACGGHSVRLLERNEKLGKKLYLTGKGRCNLTNTSDPDTFMSHLIHNGRFMHSALSLLDPSALMSLMESWGVPLCVQRGNRVFPASEKSSDVIKTLSNTLGKYGVEIMLHTRVHSLSLHDSSVRGVVLLDGSTMDADTVILATGGKSYPSTGSTGDGYTLCAQVGHTVHGAYPALTSLHTVETWPGLLSGLTLKNICLSAQFGKKNIFSGQGELLFTHQGISGPLALSLSSYIAGLDVKNVEIKLDIKSGLSYDMLDARLQRELVSGARQQLKNVLPRLMPRSLAPVTMNLLCWPEDLRCDAVTRIMRKSLVELLKGYPLRVRSLGGFEEAVVTRGGVDVKEIDPKSMASRLVSGLRVCGELLDVDALTGGYNLHVAFATGYAAGVTL